MITYKNNEEIELIRISSLLVAKTLAEVAKQLKPGITTLSMDRIAETYIRDHEGSPAFKGYNGFPNTLCISINEQVVHGIPGDRIIKEGDIVSVDCGVRKNSFYGDSAYTFAVGEVKQDVMLLLRATKNALYKGIENALVGKRLGDIGYEIQYYVESFGFSVVRDLVGHGIGKHLHEKPNVFNYGKKGSGLKLQEGIVIAIEPMVNMGKKEIVQEKDGWTIRTIDNLPSAHYEHTVALKKEKTEILSTFEYIEEINNNNLTKI
jgi:methionyl aminopeptidase